MKIIMELLRNKKQIKRKTSWSTNILLLTALMYNVFVFVTCVNPPQSITEVEEVEITEDLIQAVRRYDDIKPFHNGFALVTKQNENESVLYFGFINTKGEEVVPCNKYGMSYEDYYICNGGQGEINSKFEDGLAAVCRNGKWGFVDTTGAEVIPCQYENGWNCSIDWESVFSEGLAAVCRNGKWGFIDTTGAEVIPCQYDDADDFSEGLAVVGRTNNLGLVKMGYVNTKGEEIIPCQYDLAYRFSEGLAPVMCDGKMGFINMKGEIIIPLQYEGANSFHDGLSKVERNGKCGFINKKGNIVIPFQYDFYGVDDFSNGMARIGQTWEKQGFINTIGENVIPCLYDDVKSFSEGLAAVCRDGKYGFINTKGDVIIPFQYDHAESFSEGTAVVSLYFGDESVRTGLIDKKGHSTFTQTDWNEYKLANK